MGKSIENIISLLCLLIINGAILYYVTYLEQDKCNCFIDWRHKYLKFYCVAIIVINFGIVLFSESIALLLKSVLIGIIIVASLIFYYSLMTYTHKLDKDKCECATKDMKDLHTFLYYYSYLFYVQVALTILLIIASVHLSLVIAEKKAEQLQSGKSKGKSKTRKTKK